MSYAADGNHLPQQQPGPVHGYDVYGQVRLNLLQSNEFLCFVALLKYNFLHIHCSTHQEAQDGMPSQQAPMQDS